MTDFVDRLQTSVSDACPAVVPLATEVLYAARRLGVENELESVIRACGQLFPGRITARLAMDPEALGDVQIVFDVAAADDIIHIMERHGEWCRRLLELGDPASSVFRLSIDARE